MAGGDSTEPAGETNFSRLVDQLVKSPRSVWADGDFLLPGEREYFPRDPVFDSYCRGAVRLVREGRIDASAVRETLDDYPIRCGNDLDCRDWVSDLLRVVAGELGNRELRRRAEVEHAEVLAREIEIHTERGEIRQALRAGRRALELIEEAGEPDFDPATHAAVLRAMGFAHLRRGFRPTDPSQVPSEVLSGLGAGEVPVRLDHEPLAEGVGLLARAAELLAGTDRTDEWLFLVDHLPEYVSPLVHTAALRGVLGVGRVIRYLETAVAAARVLPRQTDLLTAATLELASLFSEVRQAERGETILRSLLERDDLSPEQRDDAETQLASTLSEQRRFNEAAELQRSLLERPDRKLQGKARARLLFNLGNSLLMLGDSDAAVRSWKEALKEAAALPEREGVADLEAQIHTVLAEQHFFAGRIRAAEAALARGEAYFATAPADIPALEFHARAARGLYVAGKPRKALAQIERSEQLLRQILARGPSPMVWESLFSHFHRLPAHAIELHLTRERGAKAARRALITAEGAKGRLLGWLRSGPTPARAELALAGSRAEDGVDRVLAWAANEPGRVAISLFGTDQGLAVLVAPTDANVRGAWFAEVPYQSFMTDCYEPWVELVESSIASELAAIWAGTVTELLLDRVGELLWRAHPALADGGSELAISSHRLFRSLPLSHCKLPGGRRLGEAFDRVLVVSSFAELAESLERPPDELDARVSALSDPDGTLPFARIEALVAADGEMRVGAEVTIEAVRAALTGWGTVLLSCHGEFAPDNPWTSRLLLSDGALQVADLFQAEAEQGNLLVLLGACETGRNRRSLSDEPLGFPAALVHAGAGAVLAPMWRVDDFSSSLYLTQYLSALRDGVHAAAAVDRTARWLRELSAGEALSLAGEWRDEVDAQADLAVWGDALSRLDQHVTWLRGLAPEERPFRSARDWAAFQLVGVPPAPPTHEGR